MGWLIALAAATGVVPSHGDAPRGGDWWGDIRLRAEHLSDGEGAPDSRLRCRLRLEADWNSEEGWAAGAGIGTGVRGDPRVPDVVLGDGRPDPVLRLDLAWVRWQPEAPERLSLTAGRARMPMMVVQDLLFDADWNPIGVSARWEGQHGDRILHGRAASFLLADMGDPDWRLHAAQTALEWRRAPTWRALGGLSFYLHESAKGRRSPLPAIGNTGWADDQRDGGRYLAEDFRVIEGFGQITWDPWLPLTAYGQASVNTAASRERSGWLAGFSLGRTRAVGGIELGWNYRRIEADATPAALTDSDFAGGGTDVEGHRIYARWQAARDLWLSLMWAGARRVAGGADERHRLWQADLQIRF